MGTWSQCSKCVQYYCGENGDHDPDGNCIPCSSGKWAENGGSCTAQQCKPSDLHIAHTQSASSDAGCKPDAGTPTAKSCNPPNSDATPVANMHASNAILPALEQLEGFNGVARPPDIHLTKTDMVCMMIWLAIAHWVLGT